MNPTPLATPTPNRQLIVPGIVGNILEWFDFSLYGYFAPIIATLFFPTDSAFLSLMATFGVFAIGFLMRPLGAIIFGHYGDKVGRQKTLSAAVLLMAIPTTLIGLLPTHAQIGASAGVLLTLCRLLQGLAIGGEFSGSIVYILEYAPANRRGLYGSLTMFSAFAGLLLGSGVGALTSSLMSASALSAWGWRIPFLMGILLGLVGFYLRTRMPETPSFLRAQATQQIVNNPFKEACRFALKPMIIAAGLVFLPAMSFYLLFVYLSSYMTNILHIPMRIALTINTLSMIGILLIIPWIGLLSDKIGRKPVLMLGAAGFVLFSYPLFLLLQQATFVALLLAQASFAVLLCLVYATIPATLVELFTTNIRYSAMSFPYNFSNALFGGTAPLVATYLIATTTNPLAPAFYLMIAAVVMGAFVLMLSESYRKVL